MVQGRIMFRFNGRTKNGIRFANLPDHFNGRASLFSGNSENNILESAPFYAQLVKTLVLQRGTGDPTIARATTGTVSDHEDVLRTAIAGEARFTGARRVRNLLAAPTSVMVTQNVTTVAGAYTLSFYGTGSVALTGTVTDSLAGTGAANRVQKTVTATAGTLTLTVTGSVTDAQLEFVSGQSIQTAAEYVSVGVLSAPYHGAGVDGVAYFDTDLSGNPIAASTLKGYLAEGARIQRCLYSQTFSNAVWVSGGGGIAVADNTVVAPDGTTTADTLTASGANGTLIQDLGVVASAAKAGGLWLKRKTGTGNIDLTLDGGATWTTKAITTAWVRYEITQTLANEDFGIRIVTSGDAVYAWQGQVETASFLSSDIASTTIAVTRNADVLTYPSAGNISFPMWAYMEALPYAGTTNSAAAVVLDINDGGANERIFVQKPGGAITAQFGMVDGGVTVASDTTYSFSGTSVFSKLAFTAGTNNFADTVNGATPIVDTSCTTPTVTTISVGSYNPAAASQFFGNIRDVRIGQRALSASELQAVSAP